MLLLVATLLLAGCASPPERELRDQYREIHDSFEAPTAPAPAESRLGEDSDFNDYLRQAFAHSPKLRASFDRWAAALERISQARSLDDPVLSFEYFLGQHDTRYQISLTQMFPAFGKLKLRDQRATAEAEAAMHTFEAERFALYGRVAEAFYEYHYLARATDVTAKTLRLLADLEQAVTARYAANQSPFSDLINIQVEKARAENELAALRDERGAQSSLLAALLNLPNREPLPWPKVEPSGSSIMDEAVLAGMLDDLNPELKAADAMVAAETRRAQLARRNVLPDFMLGASWMVMPGMDGRGDESDVSLMAGISVPLWWGRYRAEIREAEAGTRAALNEKTNMRNMLRAELGRAVFQARDAERRIALFATSLLPKAEQSLAAARAAYAEGQAGFMALVDAQRTLLEFKLLAERAAVDREIALADIGCCIGAFAVPEMTYENP